MKKDAIGQLIVTRRKSLGVNQAEVARLSGISLHSLCMMERGQGNPTMDAVLSVLDVLGLEILIAPRDMERV